LFRTVNLQFTNLAVSKDSVSAVSVASASSVDSGRGKTDNVAGSPGDSSADETVGIVSTAATAQRNCTLCAGAITQEVYL